MEEGTHTGRLVQTSPVATCTNTHWQSANEGLNGKTYRWLQLDGGDISLDIPFYRTSGLEFRVLIGEAVSLVFSAI
jgi:hypothetical protein